MAQHDAIIDNQAGAAIRSDLNNFLAAIISNSSGATAPATTYAYMWWADTTAGLLKQRNAANSAWITIGTLADAYLGLLPLSGGTLTGLLNLKTGANIASAATLNLSTATGNLVHITGAVATSAVTMTSGEQILCIADAAWPLTYHATNNKISGGADHTLTAGDMVFYTYDGTTVRGVIIKADGKAVVGGSSSYIYIRDEKANTTAGGTFTSGAWRTRDLNTEVNDAGAYASVAANQITLAAGTYRFTCRAPAFAVINHKIRLANITDSIYYYGTSEYAQAGPPNIQTTSFVSGRFTISVSKVFELQHYCNTTVTTTGFGQPGSFGVTEVYAECEFWREP